MLPLKKLPPLNSSYGLLRCSRCRLRKLLVRPPSSGRRRIGTVSRSSRRRLDRSSWWSRLGITLIGIFLLLLHKGALTNLLITCTFKDRRGTRHGFIESDLTGLHNLVSFKVKYTICMRVRGITKKNTIGRPGLEFVQITLFQDEALASKHPKVTYIGWSSEMQLVRSLLHESSKENTIGNMARGVDCFSPIPPRSPMLIEHRPSHPNKGPILALNNTILLWDISRGKLMLEA